MQLADLVKGKPKYTACLYMGKRVTRERRGPHRNQSGHLGAEPQEMTKVLNEYFSILTMEKDMKTRKLGKVNGNVFRIVHIAVEEVVDVLRHKKVDKSLVPYQVFPSKNTVAVQENVEVLAEIHELLLAAVPEDWTIPNVASI